MNTGNRTKNRPKSQKFSINKPGSKARVATSTKGVEGADRSGIDDLAELTRLEKELAETWDD